MRASIKALIAGLAVSVAAASAAVLAADISGAGATFPYPIYAKWADTYKKETGNNLNYQSIGSGGGIQQITARNRHLWRLRHAPLTAKELAACGDLIQWPMVMGGIVPVVNIDGVKEQTTSPSMAPRLPKSSLVKSRPGTIRRSRSSIRRKFPSPAIAVVHRADGSGTTFNFALFDKVSPEWKSKVGVEHLARVAGRHGAKGNEGVSQCSPANGSIGYVEYAYAKQNKLNTAKMVNKDGKTVEATGRGPGRRGQRRLAHGAGLYRLIADQPGATRGPSPAATFILMPKKVKDAASSEEALKFFAWAYANGEKAAEELDYVPMPENVKKLVMSTWAEITGPDSKRVLAAN